MSSYLSSYSYKSSSGPVLNCNEDTVDINLVNNLFMIFDGFGGEGIGDQSVQYVKEKILDFYANSCSDPDATLPYFYDPRYIVELNVLVNAIHHVHKEFIKDNLSRPINLRSGMSFIIGLLVDSLFMTVSTGSCASFLRRNGKMVTTIRPEALDDSVTEKNRDASTLFPSSAFGLYNKLQINISELKVNLGDQILFCTDGVYAYQNLNEMNYILAKNNLTNNEKTQELIDLANIRGNWDNQSVILLNF